MKKQKDREELTLIQVSKTIAELLKTKKIIPRETYNSVLKRIINIESDKNGKCPECQQRMDEQRKSDDGI